MSLIPTRRRVAYGEPLPLDAPRRRPTADAGPSTLTAAVAPSMREVWRGPNDGGYVVLIDSGTNQAVLYNYPTTSAPHAGEAADVAPRRGMYGNPDGGPTVPLAVAAPRELENGDEAWSRATGTKDAAGRAFDAKVHRLRTGVRMRGWNDANRARYGQPPIGGGPDRAA